MDESMKKINVGFSSSGAIAAAVVRSIFVRDIGTEMTPSRTDTPVKSTTPVTRSSIASGSSTPVKSVVLSLILLIGWDLLLDKLQRLVMDGISRLLMIQSEMERLSSNLEKLRVLLNGSPGCTAVMIRDIRFLIYEVEDLVDEILLEGLRFQLIQQRGSKGTNGWFTTVEKCLTGVQLLGFNLLLRTEIWGLIPRIQVVNRGLLVYRDPLKAGSLLPPGQRGQLGAPGDSDDDTPLSERRNGVEMERFWKYEEDSIVGIEDAKDQVTRLLIEEKEGGKGFKMVAICGMAGIGKTTLARSVFNDPPVRRHFDCFALASVGSCFQTRLVFQDILLSLCSCPPQDLIPYSDSELAEKIFNVLRTRRYLIVLDDVWDNSAWDCLSLAFPSSENTGSRVLVTTRYLGVAHMTASGNGFIYPMSSLNQEQSLHLLLSTAFRAHSPDAWDIQNVTKYAEVIAKKCSGLPLAIVVVGGILASKKPTPNEWMMISHKIGSFQENSDFLGPVLNLSYDSLPHHLKLCFLYLGIFPKGAEIKTETLTHLWLAEGLIIPDKDTNAKVSMMDIAEWYLYELCIRSLVSVHKHEVPTGRWFKSCYVHDLIHDECLLKQVEGDFLVAHFRRATDINLRSSSLPFPKSKVRRLALSFQVGFRDFYKKDVSRHHLQSVSNGSALKDHQQSSQKLADQCDLSRLRVLYLRNSKMLELPEALCQLSNLRSLRTLHFVGFNFNLTSPLNGIGKLRYLKCLSLRNCFIKSLPSSICSLPNLETLDLQECTRTKIVIPVELQKLISIRYLYLPRQFEVQGDDKLQFNGLTNLEILVNFDSKLCEVKDLQRLTKLQKLVATISGDLEELAEINNTLRISLNSLIFSSLQVRLPVHCSMKNHLVLQDGLEFPNVKVLRLEGHIGKITINIAHSLSKISLAGSELNEDPMEKLEKLPNLLVLTFRNNAFVGKCMTCSDSGMPQLRHLAFLNLDNLKNLVVREGGMPNLSTLALERCQSLKDPPEGLSSLTRLQELKALYMPSEFMVQVNLAREILRQNKCAFVISSIYWSAPSLQIVRSAIWIICRHRVRVEERAVEPEVWSLWKSRALSYLLDKRTIRLVSGAKLLLSAPKHQWVEVLRRMAISDETDDYYEKILLLSGSIGSKWSSLIEKVISSSYKSVTISKLYREVQDLLFRRSQNPCFEEHASTEEKGALEYLEDVLTNKVHCLLKLFPIIPAAAIPLRSPLLKSYLIELESRMRGDSSAIRCCNCVMDRKNHTECEVAERIWCLYIFHACGSWVERRVPVKCFQGSYHVAKRLVWRFKSEWKPIAQRWQRSTTSRYSYDAQSYSQNFDDDCSNEHRSPLAPSPR
ncbi:OLC1v1019582C1 [Oldenlandia corymbosa var. corymbosa]|uniref:OLC1v1019582C1 n=1 Tax=Oldenlandia corymbosa var. corymbosa TaxID=529605 RepID=A0AAV1EEU0_OLDCO|nr:OLC1v1019582C1 [Oldenlandia corymbosa var. corymbosa]